MKTPEEIKKGLELCVEEDSDCNRCPCSEGCIDSLLSNALAYIQQLEAELEQTKQERDGLSIMLTNAKSTAETHKRERDAAVYMFVRLQSDIPCDEFCGSEYCEECRLSSPSAECWVRYLMHSAVTEED